MAQHTEPVVLWQPTPERKERSTLTRFARWVREERGLAYSIYAWNQSFADTGLVGIGCAASFMSVVFLCARWFSARELSTALSWVFAASNLGTLAAATPLAWIAAEVGWRNGFLGLAALTLLVAVLFYAVVRDRPPGSTLPTTHRAVRSKMCSASLSDGGRR